MRKTSIIILSGFLGSGKTTLMLAAANELRSKGVNVACITNDQGEQLVDSKMVWKNVIPLQQIQGGCFCCKFDNLVDSINEILEKDRPDVILAEAVGSCTDLVATVIKPLKSKHGDRLDVRPLTVVADPRRLAEQFITKNSAFTTEVSYLYEKQLEEAQCIIVNKVDLLSEKQVEQLDKFLIYRFQSIPQFTVSALHHSKISVWLDHICNQNSLNEFSLDIDYDIYAEGEAQLGWLNSSVLIKGDKIGMAALSAALMNRLCECFRSLQAEIAHLKIWVEDDNHSLKMSAIKNAEIYDLDHETSSNWITQEASLWINARIHISPWKLEEVVRETLDAIQQTENIQMDILRLDCFSPGRPNPTYRMA